MEVNFGENREQRRYSVRVEPPGGLLEEIALSPDPVIAIEAAKRHYREHGWQTSVVNLRTGIRLWVGNAQRARKAGGR